MPACLDAGGYRRPASHPRSSEPPVVAPVSDGPCRGEIRCTPVRGRNRSTPGHACTARATLPPRANSAPGTQQNPKSWQTVNRNPLPPPAHILNTRSQFYLAADCHVEEHVPHKVELREVIEGYQPAIDGGAGLVRRVPADPRGRPYEHVRAATWHVGRPPGDNGLDHIVVCVGG
jgi:hypothetical protein